MKQLAPSPNRGLLSPTESYFPLTLSMKTGSDNNGAWYGLFNGICRKSAMSAINSIPEPCSLSRKTLQATELDTAPRKNKQA
jgi:hypothetical protein